MNEYDGKNFNYETFKRALERIPRDHPAIIRYRQANYDSYCNIVKESLEKKSYIEAFCIAEQYVKQIMKILLGFSRKDKQRIDITKSLMLLGCLFESAKQFRSEYQDFNNTRDDLVHEVTVGEKIRISKGQDLDKMCMEILEKANNFFEEIMAEKIFPIYNYSSTRKQIPSYYRREIDKMIDYAIFEVSPTNKTPMDKLQKRIKQNPILKT